MIRILMVALPLLALSGPVFAVSTAQRVLNDPNRHAVEVARELGVTALQFATCFAGVTPAKTAAELNGQRERDNKSVLLPCLRKIKPSITNERLDQVMNKYRTPRPN